MPSVFEQSGLRFEYPENWSLEDSTANDDHDNDLDDGLETRVQQVVVSSPNTAFWHLSKYSPAIELESLFDEALAALRSEYQGMETEPAAETVLEERSVTGFDVGFVCLDLTNTCWVRGFATSEATYLLLCQAEDREFAQVQLVFQAMLASLLRNLS